ncbi:MAG: hypothetical protein ABIJ84_02865 [bacterium]
MEVFFTDAEYLFFIKRFFKKLPWFLGRHAFWVIIFLVFLSMALGWLLFYNYIITPENRQPETRKGLLSFREDVYQKVLNQRELSDQKLKQPQAEDRLNPFVGN